MPPDTLLSRRKTTPAAVLLGGVLALSALAGCIGFGDDAPPDPAQPEAVLEVDRDERWVGESFTFNATRSSVAEGTIGLLRIDLGDGTVHETNDTTEAIVHHAYDVGGVYLVNLTVIAALPDGANRTATTQERVAVHERYEGREALMHGTPIDGAPTASAMHPFAVRDGANLWEVDVHLEAQNLVGETEVLLRVLSPTNETLAEANVTLEADGNETVRFHGTPIETGGHALNVTVESGGVRLTSLVRVYYDADAA